MHHEAPQPDRLERKRELRLEAILDAATALLAAEGLEALTLQRVATATGYVPAALYRYVGSKDGLLAALQRRAVLDAHEAFVAAQETTRAATAGAPPKVGALAALLAAARFYADLPRTRPETWLLVALLLGDPRPLLSDAESLKTAPLLRAFLADVHGLFEGAERALALAPGPAVLRTLTFWAALQGAATLEKLRRIAVELPAASEVGLSAAHALLLGWGADPDALRRASEGPAAKAGSAKPGSAKPGSAKAGSAKPGSAKAAAKAGSAKVRVSTRRRD